MAVRALVLATLETKGEETGYLTDKLDAAGISFEVIDTSLAAKGQILAGDAKSRAMNATAERAISEIVDKITAGAEVVVGIGGGTGAEIALQIMRSLPISFPKVLCTTLPFDPRFAVADNAIVLVPTLADISGLNGVLRDALENTALIAAGLCQKRHKGELTDIKPSVGLTALGATEGAVRPLIKAFADQGRETTVFHSNGFGGAAFSRFAASDAFDAIIDLTPHELTRLHVAGAHVAMPDRFTAGGNVPRIVLPGALNFVGLGQLNSVPDHLLARPHYRHSPLFTHVKLTGDEMEHVSSKLAAALNGIKGPCAVILPMGGFSHHDRPGGAIEDPDLRAICAETLETQLNSAIPVTRLDAHLFAPEVTANITATLAELSA